MSKSRDYEEFTENLVQPIVDKYNFELVDVEYVKEGSDYFLRVYIDKEGGITINDCETVSRALSALLDEKDPIPDAYILEVSSPGLGRQLKKEKDYKRSLGEEVEIKLFKAENKVKEFVGILADFDEKFFYLDTEKEERKPIERSNVAVIKLTVDF